jgi:transcriptional regulator with XRE-family HTH domain
VCKQFVLLTLPIARGKLSFVISREQRVIYSRFGRLLARHRKKAGLSQEALAAAVGLSRTSITNVECGRQPIQLHSLYALATALNAAPDDLLPAVPNIRPALRMDPENILELNVSQAQWIRSIARIRPDTEKRHEQSPRKNYRKGDAVARDE